MPRMTGTESRRRKISITLSQDAMGMIEQMASWKGGSYLSHVIEDCIRQVHRRWEKDNRRSISKPITRRAPTRAQMDAIERATATVAATKRRRRAPEA